MGTRVCSPRRSIEHLLSQAVEFAPNGVVLTKADGRIVLANAELERMFGYTRAELFELPVDRLVAERFRTDHAMLRALHGKDLRSRVMIAGREISGLRTDGTEFPIEIGLSALRTLDGVMIVETILEVPAWRNLERLSRKLFEAVPCGAVAIDARGGIVLVNPQTEIMFGYSREELIGNTLEMLVSERPLAARGDLTARRKDGTEFPVEVRLHPLPDENGRLTLAAVFDITRRKIKELELQQANASLEEFVYAASHELKSPLQGVAHLIEWIAEELGGRGPPEVTRNLGRIGDRIRHLERMVDDLLAYARAGRASADVTPLEPHTLVEQVLENQTLPPGFQISMHIDAEPFFTNRTPLETVLRNLISNAVKHHDLQVGTIEVRVEDVGEYCLFTVSDDGPGIPVAAQERVFQMFQTLSPANRGNSGIGLALSKRLVESHGGRMTLVSEGGARGSSFRVWWPRFQRREGL